MLNANSIRIGNIINFKKKLCAVVKTAHTQPGKGGAYVQMELKDIITGTKYTERFRSEDKIEKIRLDERELQFLYADSDNYNFMDNKSFEQIALSKELISEEQQVFLEEDIIVIAQSHENNIVFISLPDTIIAEIDSTESVVKGQTAASSSKPAILKNGVKVTVPPFINPGDKIIIKPATLEYVERVK